MEKWMSILQTYSEILTGAAVVVMGLFLAFFLIRILRQIKRLNRSLGSITENIQAYFDVILQEEAEEEREANLAENRQEAKKEPELAESKEKKTEGSESPAEQELRKQEEEKVFNAVLQEYFS